MTLGIYREESALPLPLFQTPRSTNVHRAYSLEHNDSSTGSPILGSGSGDTEESFDQLADLHTIPLRAMRSGQSLRQRSNSTPSQSLSLSRSHSRHQSFVSYQSSGDRPGSNSGTLFPTWARQYYGHGVALMSASKVSLVLNEAHRTSIAQHQIPQMFHHSRGDSEWTDISSGYTTSVSGTQSQSPASHRFLPRIFRSRTRLRVDNRDRSRRSPPFFQTKQRSTILPVPSKPLPIRPVSVSPAPEHDDEDFLSPQAQVAEMPHVPSNGSNEYDVSSVPHLPRPEQSHQRPHSAQDEIHQAYHHHDRGWLSRHERDDPSQYQNVILPSSTPFHFESTPHLHANKRNTQQGLPTWQAPSFVDSLDTLVRANGNRQILFFVLGFVLPPFWILAAFLPVPQPPSLEDGGEYGFPAVSASPSWVARDNAVAQNSNALRCSGQPYEYNDVDDSVRDAVLQQQQKQHEQQSDMELAAQYRAARLKAERMFLKAQWWRTLNRIMSVVGVLVIAAIVSSEC